MRRHLHTITAVPIEVTLFIFAAVALVGILVIFRVRRPK